MSDSSAWDLFLKYAVGPITALLVYVWKKQEEGVKVLDQSHKDRIEALRKDHGEKIESLARETDRNRDVAAKIFDKLDSMSRESADRHERLLTVIHSGLAGKADK